MKKIIEAPRIVHLEKRQQENVESTFALTKQSSSSLPEVYRWFILRDLWSGRQWGTPIPERPILHGFYFHGGEKKHSVFVVRRHSLMDRCSIKRPRQSFFPPYPPTSPHYFGFFQQHHRISHILSVHRFSLDFLSFLRLNSYYVTISVLFEYSAELVGNRSHDHVHGQSIF